MTKVLTKVFRINNLKYLFATPLALILFPLMWINVSTAFFTNSAIIILTIELCKSARFSLNGVLGSVENILSVLLLVAVSIYSWTSDVENNAMNIILVVQVCDVIAGFFLAVNSARRDIAL